MEEVIGSIPIRSTNKPFNTNYLQTLSDRLQLRRGAEAFSEHPATSSLPPSRLRPASAARLLGCKYRAAF